MITPTYMKAINTLEDIFTSKLEIHTTPTHTYLMQSNPRPIIQKLIERLVPSLKADRPADIPALIERFVHYLNMHIAGIFLASDWHMRIATIPGNEMTLRNSLEDQQTWKRKQQQCTRGRGTLVMRFLALLLLPGPAAFHLKA